MVNYISFSLFGESTLYTVGAIENIKLCSTIYPGWTPVVYVDDLVPDEVKTELRRGGALVIQGSAELCKDKRSWRLAATLIENADIVMFRDTDSRLNNREQACVKMWLESGRPLHIMRDHPFHSSWVMAGMWGVYASVGRNYVSEVLSSARGESMSEDQELLASKVYSRIGHRALVHDSFFRRESWAIPFPTQRLEGQFVGERIDAREKPEIGMREKLISYESNPLLKLKLRARDILRVKFEQKLN
jgi:hypothetical protein